jgi:hypothetical protein
MGISAILWMEGETQNLINLGGTTKCLAAFSTKAFTYNRSQVI